MLHATGVPYSENGIEEPSGLTPVERYRTPLEGQQPDLLGGLTSDFDGRKKGTGHPRRGDRLMSLELIFDSWGAICWAGGLLSRIRQWRISSGPPCGWPCPC